LKEYDLAIIGGGPGGEAAAARALALGLRTCVIEAGRMGGVCLNVGCIPTKAMLYASDLFTHVRDARKFGISLADASVDGPAFMKRVRDVVDTIVGALERRYESSAADLLRGRARLTGRDTIHVDLSDGGSEQIKARSIILATGSSPARPGVFPWESPRVMTTDEIVLAETLPESLLIVGGGVIGCEFATVFAELGIPVTLVEMLDRLTAPLDEDASKLVHRSLRRLRVDVKLRTRIASMSADASGVSARTEDGQTLTAAAALIAVGRKANIDNLGLEVAGVATKDGIIPVDDCCRTSAANIYAVGDVAERRQYAHLASRMGVVAAENAAGLDSRDDRTVVPVGMFTHPEVATVGASEAEVRAAGADPGAPGLAAVVQYRATGIAWAYDRTDGIVKIVADPAGGRILGAVVVGYHAADVVQEIALAMRHSLTVAQVAETVHAHPTFCEGVMLAAEQWLAAAASRKE
jgi:dihydrolipoamide dehydrogenase